MPVKTTLFGTYDQQPVFKVALCNNNGVVADFLTYGATWHSYIIKNKAGLPIDVVVGPKSLKGYTEQFKLTPYFFGSTIGRHAGRIRFNRLNPKLKNYSLSHKNGIQLHGGIQGFDKKNWTIANVKDCQEPAVTFSYESPHLEEGYPGTLQTTVTFALASDNSISIVYKAVSDKDTLVNLTNHTYFNLGGSSMISHSLYVDSNTKLELDSDLLPTGNLIGLNDTPYDFKDYCNLGNLLITNGMDDIFVLNRSSLQSAKIKLASKSAGLEMLVHTNQPVAVIFAPKMLKFANVPRNKEIDYTKYPAICFETQFPPDSLNHPKFPSCILKKGETYTQKTLYRIKQFNND